MDRPSPDRTASRRSVLRAGGTALAAGLPALGAGCTTLPPLGTKVHFGDVDVPESGEPAYRDWLASPSDFPVPRQEFHAPDVEAYAPPPPSAPSWVGGGMPRLDVVSRSDYVGWHVEDVDLAIRIGPTVVLEGGDGRDAIDETIARTSYQPAGSYRDYDVYTHPDASRVVGVGQEALVFGNGSAARAAMETTIDAGEGEIPRYHERDDDAARLTDSVGMRTWANVNMTGIVETTRGDFLEQTVGTADAFDYDGDSAYTIYTWLFPPAVDLTEGKVKQFLKQDDDPGFYPPTPDAVEVSVEGRVATIEGILRDPAGLSGDWIATSDHVPYTTWSATFDPDSDTVTFRHEAGDPVQAEWLSIDAEDSSVSMDDLGDGATVAEGDVLSASAPGLASGTTVRLTYRPPNGTNHTSLFTYEIP